MREQTVKKEVVSFGQYWSLLKTYLGPQWPRVSLMAFLLLGSIALQLLAPQFIRVFIDAVQRQSPLTTLITVAALFLLVALGSRLVSALASYFCEDVSWVATNKLRADLLAHCLALDLAFHKEHTAGELIERVDSEVDTLAGFFSQFVVQVLGNALLIVGIIVVAGREDWRIAAAFVLFTLLSSMALIRVSVLATPAYKRSMAANAEQSGFFGEVLSALEDLAANAGRGYVLWRNALLQRKVNTLRLRGNYWWATIEVIGETIFTGSIILVLALGSYFFAQKAITLATVFLLYNYASQLVNNIFAVTDQFNDLQKATASIQRINELYHTQSRIQDGPGLIFPTVPLALSFQAVSFSYTPEQPVLTELSFKLAPGELLGLLGRTGSGKTTLARLLLRFYDPTAGAILLNGEDIRQARLAELRQQIGIVTQDVQLFQASLRDNLTFFDRSLNDERLLAAIEQLGLQSWLKQLPNGLETQLSADTLSAGEAQLLAFTRILLKDPRLIILDEATSRLDPATEQILQQAMLRLLRGRTGIVIAHRLSTIEQVDKILLLEAGRCREFGSRADLIQQAESRYATLLKMADMEDLFV